MSWASSITVNNLRALKGNDDNCYDDELGAYISALVTDIEYLTGLDFNFPSGTQTATFTNTKRKNQFVMAGSILQIGAWQTVSLVERSYIQTTPDWRELTEYNDYTLESPVIQGFTPITEIYFLYERVEEREQIKVIGTMGFSANIPDDLLYVMAEMVDAYYQKLASGTGAYDITSEKSLTRSITYQLNGLTSLKLYTPARIPEFLAIINKYNVKLNYPF